MRDVDWCSLPKENRNDGTGKERLRSIGRPEPPRVQGLSLFPGMPKLSGNPFENGQSIVENFMKKLPV
jgi:hypothetical protein